MVFKSFLQTPIYYSNMVVIQVSTVITTFLYLVSDVVAMTSLISQYWAKFVSHHFGLWTFCSTQGDSLEACKLTGNVDHLGLFLPNMSITSISYYIYERPASKLLEGLTSIIMLLPYGTFFSRDLRNLGLYYLILLRLNLI
jgi:hypothetical protein